VESYAHRRSQAWEDYLAGKIPNRTDAQRTLEGNMKDRDYTRSGLRIVLTALAAVIAAVVLLGLSETPVQMATLPPPPNQAIIMSDPADAVVAVGTDINFTAVFTDPPPPAVVNVTWSWGDGTEDTCYWSECEKDGTTDNPVYSHSYTDPGVYTVQAIVAYSSFQPDTPTLNYVIAYDPTGGFVTGAGWIDSQAGAYKLDDTLSGKATFGFVSKYKKGATVPTGNTEFVFEAGDLNFHSASYQGLVVTGRNYAQFKGSGTINGEGDYRFMLWAGDAEPDTFRIRIWEEDERGNETDVYDNGFDQEIGGGSIVIHTKK
jgi:PKD repeat protein